MLSFCSSDWIISNAVFKFPDYFLVWSILPLKHSSTVFTLIIAFYLSGYNFFMLILVYINCTKSFFLMTLSDIHIMHFDHIYPSLKSSCAHAFFLCSLFFSNLLTSSMPFIVLDTWCERKEWFLSLYVWHILLYMMTSNSIYFPAKNVIS
jgi:hypothetical protein